VWRVAQGPGVASNVCLKRGTAEIVDRLTETGVVPRRSHPPWRLSLTPVRVYALDSPGEHRFQAPNYLELNLAMATTPAAVLKELESLGNEKVRAQNWRNGAGDNQFGVKLGDIRKIAARIKTDDKLAAALWKTGNLDARLLAILVLTPKQLSRTELEKMVRASDCPQVAEWLMSYVVKEHADKEPLREKWMALDYSRKNIWAARAGWALTSSRINNGAEGLDPSALLDRIEAEMGDAPPEVQWTMNFCLAGIGIQFPKLRPRAIAIGESLGIYRDYPTSKGCTSPFAPIWINEMVRRQKKK
jgi:3-methyladenine DNA glycosylase AlkD